jgi:hypothetical protein
LRSFFAKPSNDSRTWLYPAFDREQHAEELVRRVCLDLVNVAAEMLGGDEAVSARV